MLVRGGSRAKRSTGDGSLHSTSVKPAGCIDGHPACPQLRGQQRADICVVRTVIMQITLTQIRGSKTTNNGLLLEPTLSATEQFLCCVKFHNEAGRFLSSVDSPSSTLFLAQHVCSSSRTALRGNGLWCFDQQDAIPAATSAAPPSPAAAAWVGTSRGSPFRLIASGARVGIGVGIAHSFVLFALSRRRLCPTI